MTKRGRRDHVVIADGIRGALFFAMLIVIESHLEGQHQVCRCRFSKCRKYFLKSPQRGPGAPRRSYCGGETEKNLAALFDKAEHKDWILFFDEADALFGKRTQVRDAHDRYANQEVAFLLQRVETYNGLVILASNLSTHVDEAFARRFEQLVHFPMPRQSERLLIWKKGLPRAASLEPSVDLAQIANRHELSGGMIMNVIRYVSMQAIARNECVLRLQDFLDGIRREYTKENRLE